jgi:hypothetical protein
MKITLNELRQIVRKIISEMDESSNYELQLPYMSFSGGGGDVEPRGTEEYDMDRLVEVKELVERALNYNIIGTIPYEGEDAWEAIEGDSMKSGEFDKKTLTDRPSSSYNDKSYYDYEIYEKEGSDVHEIAVNYYKTTHHFDGNNYFRGYSSYAESFIFYGYPNK